MTKDAMYKDGYKVKENGDYLVHSEGEDDDARHSLTRMSDGTNVGVYLSREAACRRAQQLGGNSHLARRVANFGGSHTKDRLTRQEQEFVEAHELARSNRRVENQLRADRVQEKQELRQGGTKAKKALQEHELNERKERLREIVSESALLKRDDRFNTPKMKRYLRRYSLGETHLETEWGRSHATNAYRRVHVEAAWLALPEKERVRRCRQHYRLSTTWLNQDGTRLIPMPVLELEAIIEVLGEFPMPEGCEGFRQGATLEQLLPVVFGL
jgi:hypothetical protein